MAFYVHHARYRPAVLDTMSRLLPNRGNASVRSDREPKLIEIDDESADEVFEALSSKTARAIFSSLHDEPATSSDLAEIADTTLQNVRYHLDKLAEADLIETTDTWYSEQGREMKVYAASNTSLVLMSGETPAGDTLRNLVKYLSAGISLLGIGSILFDRLVYVLAGNVGTPTMGAQGGTPTPKVETVVLNRTVTNQTATKTPMTSPTTSTVGIHDGAMVLDLFGVSVPPGGIFFIGGLFVLLLTAGWHYRRSLRFG